MIIRIFKKNKEIIIRNHYCIRWAHNIAQPNLWNPFLLSNHAIQLSFLLLLRHAISVQLCCAYAAKKLQKVVCSSLGRCAFGNLQEETLGTPLWTPIVLSVIFFCSTIPLVFLQHRWSNVRIPERNISTGGFLPGECNPISHECLFFLFYLLPFLASQKNHVFVMLFEVSNRVTLEFWMELPYLFCSHVMDPMFDWIHVQFVKQFVTYAHFFSACIPLFNLVVLRGLVGILFRKWAFSLLVLLQ